MKRYTAQEMREMALVEESYGWDVVATMLRQAADDMERARKYEYAVLFSRNEKPVARSAGHYATLEEAGKSNTYVPYGETISFVRREVGEWEEVKDEEG